MATVYNMLDKMKMQKYYMLLWLLRIALVLLPQTAYIHPDEFFQTVEVVAGDILDLDTFRPWEFNTTSPLRSVTLPFTALGPPLLFFKFLASHVPMFWTSYFVLVLPRLVMVLLSIIVDLAVFYMCKRLDLNAWMGLILVSSSYVTLTYLTRTFTNSFETVLFSLLLVVLIREWKSANSSSLLNFKVITADVKDKKSKKKFKSKKKVKSTFVAEIPKFRPYECITSNYLPLSSFLVGMLVVVGLFNRATFLMFSIVPISVWILFCYQKQNKVNSLLVILIFSGLGFLLLFVIFVFVDSVYFNPQILTKITDHFENCQTLSKDYMMCMKDTIMKCVVVTPWNFISYNRKSDNLAVHGIHPWYLHLLVNLPLLFGPACLVSHYFVIKVVLSIYKRTVRVKNVVLMLCIYLPVILLSYFPHQEPRFLIPILPLVILITVKLINSDSYNKLFLSSWLIFNVFLTFLFGFLHQGGLTPCIQYIQNNLGPNCVKSASSNHCFTQDDTFLFYHTYMPPRYLFLGKNTNNQVVDLQGQNWSNVMKYGLKNKGEQSSYHGNMYLIIPGTLVSEAKSHIEFDNVATFPLHLSMENLPDLSSFSSKNLYNFISELSSQLSLFILRINR